MTLVISWVRKRVDGLEELVIASDSRTSCAGNLDCSPKIFPLTRGDSAIAFAGDTYFAYPLMLQLMQAIDSYSPLLDRADDFRILRNHTLSIFNSMVKSFEEQVKGVGEPSTQFLLAGYSWKKKRFEINTIEYSQGDKRFAHRPCKRGIGNFGLILFGGDQRHIARNKLNKLLQNRFGRDSVDRRSTLNRKFDMEPFEVLRDIIRGSGKHDSVGGAPQLLKITLYMECRRIAVFWPNMKSGRKYLGGRPLLEYENSESWVLDPDTFIITHPHYAPVKPKYMKKL